MLIALSLICLVALGAILTVVYFRDSFWHDPGPPDKNNAPNHQSSPDSSDTEYKKPEKPTFFGV